VKISNQLSGIEMMASISVTFTFSGESRNCRMTSMKYEYLPLVYVVTTNPNPRLVIEVSKLFRASRNIGAKLISFGWSCKVKEITNKYVSILEFYSSGSFSSSILYLVCLCRVSYR
jgi:hypothetical protein